MTKIMVNLYFCDKLDQETYKQGESDSYFCYETRKTVYYPKCDHISLDIENHMDDPVKYILNNLIVKKRLNHLGNTVEEWKNKISIHIIKKGYNGSSHGDSNIVTLYYNWAWDTPKKIEKIDYFVINYPPPELSPSKALENVVYDENTPIILLDVDGVINCFGYGYNINTEKKIDVLSYYGNKMNTVQYNQYVVDKINELSKTCKIYWATSWKNKAKYRLAPLIGLNNFEICEQMDKNLFEWDFPTQYLENNRPVIWIEDQIDYYIKDEKEAKGVTGNERNLLKIIPKCNIGLEKKHFEEIDEFIRYRLMFNRTR